VVAQSPLGAAAVWFSKLSQIAVGTQAWAGGVLGCPGGVLGCPGGVLGCPGGVLGCPGGVLGSPCGVLGPPSSPHDTPLNANEAGVALAPVKVPWKPNRADAPVASGPFQATLEAVTALPAWVTVAFHEFVTRWSPAHVQDSVHELTAAPPLVTCTSAVNPPVHWFTA
jgi:hypothetical protein